MADFLECPSCGCAARIIDRFTLPGRSGPVEHVKLVCQAGHWFIPPSASPIRQYARHAVHMSSASAVAA
jgi:hypothetical protein